MKKQTLIIAVITLLLGLFAVPALAQTDVGIGTPPFITGKPIYYDANADGVSQPGELIGVYDVYNPQLPFHFYWYGRFGAQYYRVSLIQYLPPGKGPDGPSQEVKVSHHSVIDPNGPQFTMSLSDGALCLDCVTVIHVVPETMAVVPDGSGGNTYQYTALPGEMVSEPFVFELPPPPTRTPGRSGGAAGPLCGDRVCSAGENNVAGPLWCPDDCGGAALTAP